MKNRCNWEFFYTADKVLDAAKAKLCWHESRLKAWAEKRKITEDKIRSEGLEITESVMEGYTISDAANIGWGPQVNVRNDLMRHLNECVSKQKEHNNKIKEYNGWVQVLTTQGNLQLKLHQDDWLYFFGK